MKPFDRVATLAAVALWCTSVQAQSTARLSVNSTGIQGNQNSYGALLSPADGRYVAFQSLAWNLVPGDTNGKSDIFVHDRQKGTTTLASVATGGMQIDGSNEDAAISGDGRFVAFESWTVPFTGYNMTELFLSDRQAGTTVSVLIHNFGGTFRHVISSDGRSLAFASDDPSVVAGDANGVHDVFVYDVPTGAFSRVSVASGGAEANGGSSHPAISYDGRYVAFESSATNLVPGDTNGRRDIFRHDRQSGRTRRVSVATGGGEANSDSQEAAISGDARYIAFKSFANNLVSGDTNERNDVFVHDTQTGATSRVSVSSAGVEGDEDSYSPGLSGDGRTVVYGSLATNLVAGDTNGVGDVFAHDTSNGLTTRVSVDSSGGEGNGGSAGRSITADGRAIAFQSQATNLVPGDTNAVLDAFVHDTSLSCPAPILYCTAKTNSLGCTPAIGASGVPTLSGFDAFLVTAENVRNNKAGIFLWATSPGAIPFLGGTLCIGPPIRRTPGQFAGGTPAPASDCSGTYSFHFSHAYAQSKGASAGLTIYGQFWSRDQGFAPPGNVGLSDGAQFTLCP
jgi:Tol biopolymer transport system component